MEKIVVATIACDRKAYSLERVLRRNAELEAPEGVETLLYLNLETALRAAADCTSLIPELGLACDIWTWTSSWRGERERDQDQRHRLPAIVTARNMAREYAMRVGADAILYVDSDVLVPRDSLVRLWAAMGEGHDLVGGWVPGRGCHRHTAYLGSGKGMRPAGEGRVEVDYATAGFLMVSRPVFSTLAWRWGPPPGEPDGEPWSEDPLYAREAYQAGFGRWLLLMDLRAEHLDDPAHPLDEGGVARF